MEREAGNPDYAFLIDHYVRALFSSAYHVAHVFSQTT